MLQKPLARSAVQAALDCNRQLFPDLLPGDVFALHLPGEPAPWLCHCCGPDNDNDDVLAVEFFTGQQALASMRAARGVAAHLYRDPTDAPTQLPLLDKLLTVAIEAPAAVDPELRGIAATAGLSARLIPTFLVSSPQVDLREARPGELRLLVLALRALLAAAEQRLLHCIELPRSGPLQLQVLAVAGEAKAPRLELREQEFTDGTLAAASEPEPEPEPRQLPLREETWHATLQPLVEAPPEPDGPDLLFCAARAGSRAPARLEVVSCAAAAAASMLDADGGDPAEPPRGLPRTVVCAEAELHAALREALAPHGVEVEHQPTLAVLPPLVRWARQRFARPLDETADPATLTALDWDWIEISMARRAQQHAGPTIDSLAPLQRFLGPEGSRRALHRDSLHAAYVRWYMCHHRPGRNNRTVAEQLLAADPPPAPRALLGAFGVGPVGFFEFERRDGERIHCREHLSGETACIDEAGSATFLEPGVVVPGEILTLGQCHLLEHIGPPLPAAALPDALLHLQHLGCTVTADHLRAAPHWLGRLWPWDEARRRERGASDPADSLVD